MKSLGRVWRRFSKRHAEAIFIIAFILADCFLSGWALTLGSIMAILYVLMPAIRTLPTLNAVGRITFLKAFVKTEKVHRLAVLLFWIYSVRLLLYAASAANLYTDLDGDGKLPSLSNAFLNGAQEWAPLAYLASPIFIYVAACLTAITLRARLKASAKDPDLVMQRQKWAGMTHVIFTSAFIGSILSITMNVHGPCYMLSNWLLVSAQDANILTFKKSISLAEATRIFQARKHREHSSIGPPANSGVTQADPAVPFMATPLEAGARCEPGLPPVHYGELAPEDPFAERFDAFIVGACSLALLALLAEYGQKLNAFLTSFCWRVVSPRSLQNVIEGFLEALRLPARNLNFNSAHPFLDNAAKTVTWLTLCYLMLFWLFGFCGGPLGFAIQSWMISAVVDAGIVPASQAPDWVFEPNLRIFIGSIVALYGTAPFAISTAVFLPYSKPRKISINADGISFAQGPFFALGGRQFRLWSDLKSVSVLRTAKSKEQLTAKFTLRFRSGGQVTFSNKQINVQDLKVMLDCIDQHAAACTVDADVYTACNDLAEQDQSEAASDGKTDTSIKNIPAQEFKSTIFIPFSAGEFLPTTKTRVIKQLCSKPLCAVYLGRDESGRMVTVKQFYLPDDTEETKALSKILKREYDLLTRIDHPGIAKVLDTFTVEKSTFLVIEHRLGTDLRATVQEHGPRSEALTLAWARQLSEIMIHLHSQEPVILHRDLTPDNVIAGEDGQLRLIDFGAAREFLEGITGTMIGKHCYVAPEQLRGDATQRSDIYSFACTLYFLLTGRDPIALSQSSPAKIIDCSEELSQLIEDCTQFDQSKRPQSFAEIQSRLLAMDKGVTLNLSTPKQKAFA